ncbi:class I SAM-dependent methyltransferase [Sedimenticola selenatireducens]|uniref:SAM-dependent methyltransferase n=1 Tax=Sedimenticola selenatireducens TaxID=191960 RepID=A0A2N6CZ87_9GAMM|nr:class I SAM-dependent methyltransferase [Sedimenticola selenatireducens]PLX62684.1 MAG: SAM-dependent methyltransferase [Sedimenticola selenatireducens]
MIERINPRAAEAVVAQLPEPDADARSHSLKLVSLIRDEIARAGGRIPFDRYMELALYAPGLGYYTAGARKFGDAGDFVTAPEISPLFARCLAHQCREVLDGLCGGTILEVGAGSGILAADLLLQLERLDCLPERYLILDLSPELRQRQRQTLGQRAPHLVDRVSWLENFPETAFSGVVIANELLDAMPVHRFRLSSGTLLEQFVSWNGERFELAWGEPASPGFAQHLAAPLGQLEAADDFESEINLRADPWLASLAGCLERGAVLLIDYGHSRAEYYHPARRQGTLMCHYRHRAHADPLVYPGLQDITAHVDFTAIAEAAVATGFNVAGYTTQAFFLMGSGLDRLVAESDPNDAALHLGLVQGVKRLTLPTEMGERFKVLGLTRGWDQPLSGFAMRDMRERL